MITVSERGKRIMDLDLQWNKYCRENNIDNYNMCYNFYNSNRCD